VGTIGFLGCSTKLNPQAKKIAITHIEISLHRLGQLPVNGRNIYATFFKNVSTRGLPARNG
jgi:hypothetical protein